jgi:PEP-CTERM motif
MRLRHLMTAVLILSFATPALQAGPTFEIDGGPPPGPGRGAGDLFYEGPNQVGGQILLTAGGFYGFDTPMNSGKVFNADTQGIFLEIHPYLDGNFGSFNTGGSFSGVILDSDVGPTGGIALIEGTISPAFAAFFGVDPSVKYGGTLQLELNPATPGSPGNYQGTADFTFGPGVVPEPASIAMMGMGLVAVAAYGRRAGLKSCKPGTPSK